MAKHADNGSPPAGNPLHRLRSIASHIPFWNECPVPSEDGIIMGVIYTQDGKCHLAQLSCDGRRHLIDLRAKTWTNGSALQSLYEQLLHNHGRVNHTRAITHVNEKLVEVAATALCCPKCGPNQETVQRVFRDFRAYLEAIHWGAIRRNH